MARIELPVMCPAGEPIAATRRQNDEVPGCRCRIEHSTLPTKESGRSLAGFCTAAPTQPAPVAMWSDRRSTSYVDCPTWQFDKDRIAAGLHSMGDEAEAAAAGDRAIREDLTGSEYGDLSMFEEIEHDASEAVAHMTEQFEQRRVA